MKIVSWNVNGLRANYKKGFLSWFNKTKAGFYCLQEIRAKEEDLPEDLLNIKGFFLYLIQLKNLVIAELQFTAKLSQKLL